jgi:hypothetical protein
MLLISVHLGPGISAIAPGFFYEHGFPVTVDAANQYFTALDGALYTKDFSLLISYPLFENGLTCGTENFVSLSATRTIGDHAFGENYRVKTIELTNVQSVESHAFFRVNCATQLILPTTLVFVGDAAFCGFDLLTDVYIPNGLTSISSSCFAWSSVLVSLELPDTIQYCESGFVSDCAKLENLWLGNSLEEINGSHPFADCPKLSHIYFPDTLQRIHEGLFAHSSLQSISIPGNLLSVDSNWFEYYNTGLIPSLHIRGPTIGQALCDALDTLPTGTRIFASNVEGATICLDYNVSAEVAATVHATHGPRPPQATARATRSFAKTPAADAT